MFVESESGNGGTTVSPFTSDQANGNQAISNIQAATDGLNRVGPATGALRAVRAAVRRAFAFDAGRTAKAGLPGIIDAPVASVPGRAQGGGMGLLSLVALTFSSLQDAHAADPNVTSLDEDSIEYKDMPHGTFELVTKEAIPRYIIVEDPGQTMVLSKTGTTIGVSQFTNSPARMDELQLAQQEVQANWAKGLGTTGSGTTPLSDTLLPVQPINFTPSDGPGSLNALPALPAVELKSEFTFIPTPQEKPATFLILNLGPGLTDTDTIVFDTFRAATGTFGASSSNIGAPLTYGISGGTAGNAVLHGVTYNVSEAGEFGTLYLNSSSGAYIFVQNDAAISALKSSTTQNFVITVSDGTALATKDFAINIEADVISGDTTGTVGGPPSGDDFARLAAARTEPSTVASGTLTTTDVDDPANLFMAVIVPTASDHGYGTFTMTAAGVWTYTLDADNSAVKALDVGDTLTDSFTVTSVDGTHQVVKIVIDGWNDAAVISGDTTGCVVEGDCRDPGVPIATGMLTSTDVDDRPDLFTPVSCGKSDGGYGTFTMTADGVWTYKLDNDNRAVEALGDRDTLTDTFTVTSVDGTAQVITITIHGDDDRDEHHEHSEDRHDGRWEDEHDRRSDDDRHRHSEDDHHRHSDDEHHEHSEDRHDERWEDEHHRRSEDDHRRHSDDRHHEHSEDRHDGRWEDEHHRRSDDEHHRHSDHDERSDDRSASLHVATDSVSGSAADRGLAGAAAPPADSKAAVTSSPAAAPDAGESFHFTDHRSDSPAPETLSAADGGKTCDGCGAEAHETPGHVDTVRAIESCLAQHVCEVSGSEPGQQQWVACHTAHDLVV
ncbi:MAG: hypothetical protein GY844_01290 [Bradyrhizobium sp.]|nr:hypothetical protein [Bradyrhizobium sp.]